MFNFLRRKQGTTKLQEKSIDENLLAIGHVVAMNIGRSGYVVDEIQRSDKGIYCLMCLQEHYGKFGTSMDNGTWYCKPHHEKLRELRKKYDI